MKPLSFLVLASTLTGCGGCLGARPTSAASGPSSSGVAPTSVGLRDGCDIEGLQNVGATWTYPGVTCPFGPDPVALAACANGGWAALIDGQGYRTLAEAVTAAQPSDTVIICPGLHPDIFTARDITLTAADPTEDATVLDGGSDYWVTLGRSTLRGVTLGPQRGVLVENAQWGDLECISVHDHTNFFNSVIDGGGGGGTITVRHSTFTRVATNVIGANALLVVEDSAFIDNTPNEETGEVVIGSQGLTMRRTAFIGNSQYGSGETGVLVVPGSNPYTTLIEDCWFEGNVNGGNDSAIVTVDAELTIRGTTFVDNTSARGVSCVTQGRGPSLTVIDSTFIGNTSATSISSQGGVLSGATEVHLERSRFEDNTSVLGTWSSFVAVSDAMFTGEDLVVHRQDGGLGALYLSYPNHATCTCCDFGALADDNQPADAYVDDHPVEDLGLNFSL